jgi:hydrogenase expression/formation protein HypD
LIKYIDEYRNPELAQALAEKIRGFMPSHPIQLMEVCGGHTLTIFKFGLHALLPSHLKLISGPGCPVCVTHNDFIDTAIALGQQKNHLIASFGDMIRVPGSHSSLQQALAEGSDIRVCYSPVDALELAQQYPHKEVIFLGIGFETTAPGIAAAILQAQHSGLSNFSVLSALKTMPMAMQVLLESGEIAINGFICPGHVSSITGSEMYQPLVRKHRIPCVISGFEPLDMLESIYLLLRQNHLQKAKVEIQYTRGVRPEGNPKAKALLQQVFEPEDTPWRGLGIIPGSGLKLKSTYANFDARRRFKVTLPPTRDVSGCICGAVMRGVKIPPDCRLFRRTCTPETPQGACMVSNEGTCATYYKYGDNL